MDSLAVLTEKILSDARTKVADLIQERKRLISEINDRAMKAQAQLREEYNAKIKEKTKVILENAKSQAELEKKKILLEARWQVINKVCEMAKERILLSPDYPELLKNLINKYAPSGATVYLSERDNGLISLPPSLLRGEPTPISGGVIICYGREKIDLSLDTLLSLVKYEIITDLARILFSKK